MKVVALLSPNLTLGFGKFLKETNLKYKYVDTVNAEKYDSKESMWTFYIWKEDAIYFGDETDQVKAIKAQYDETEAKIESLREYQEELVKRLRELPTNEAPIPVVSKHIEAPEEVELLP